MEKSKGRDVQAAMGSLKKIALLGPYGVGNLGCAAIVEAAISNLRRHCPGCEIYGININPEDTLARHGIPSLPIHWYYHSSKVSSEGSLDVSPSMGSLRNSIKKLPVIYPLLRWLKSMAVRCFHLFREIRFLVSSFLNIRGFDLLIVNGDGQLCDLWGGAWLHPYALLKWALLAKAARVRFVVMSVGAGPIDRSLSKIFFRYALRLAEFRSFRNEHSMAIVASLGVGGEHYVYPDIAFGLKVSNQGPVANVLRSTMVVGVNPMAYYDPRRWPKSDPEIYGNYIRKLSDAILWILGCGHSVEIFSSDRMDKEAIEDVERRVREAWGNPTSLQLHSMTVNSVDALLSRIRGMDVVLATRLHCLLLSSLFNKPLLAISPQTKVEALMKNLGQGEFVVDIRHFTQEELRERFNVLESRREAIASEIDAKVARFRVKLDDQYRRVLKTPSMEISPMCGL